MAGQWAKKLSSVGTFAVALGRLSFWSQLSVSQAAGCGCAEGTEAVAQPQAAAPSTSAPAATAACTAASLVGAQRCPPTCSESLPPAQLLQDREVMKKALISGHKHLQYSCLGATELQPNGWNPKGSAQHSGQSRVS